MESDRKPALAGLAMLRKPFPENQISKLPKPTKAQTDAVRADYKAGIRCDICGTWHHPKVVHLDYVGHAALTDRLLDCDPHWNWEPIAVGDDGFPRLDANGGMWIKLTVCGVTRLGYGHPDGKKGGDAIKEVIGDALRNAAMRFGAALDLWHKGGDLHADADDTAAAPPPHDMRKATEPGTDPEARAELEFKRDTILASLIDLPDDEVEAWPKIWAKEINALKVPAPDLFDQVRKEFNLHKIRAADRATSKGANE